jgi:hypothetical protein
MPQKQPAVLALDEITMKQIPALLTLAAILLLAGVIPRPAQAQFYNLDGKLACARTPNALCYDTTPPRAPAPIQIDRPARSASRPEVPQAPGISIAPDTKALARRPIVATDPLQEIATRLQAGRPSPGDLTTLRSRAEARDGKALELLGWCEFIGLGVPRDPIFAYLLYGAAAKVGVPNAARNQATIYETALAPEQRQQVLDLENSSQPRERE